MREFAATGVTVLFQANEITGFVLARLGASLNETAAVAAAACQLVDAAVGNTEATVAAVQRGWRNASKPPDTGLHRH